MNPGTNLLIPVAAGIGLALSFYALRVRNRALADPGYRPLCDLAAAVSCTRAFTSRFGHSFGFPNPLAGMMYYALILCLFLVYPAFIRYASIPALIFSVYLAAVSYAVQKNFCLVCTSIYLINLAIFILSAT